MSGYINGKIDIWSGDSPMSNLNSFWYKKDQGNYSLMSYNNALSTWNDITRPLGTNYILVKGDGTSIENAVKLQEAYNFAKFMTPNGLPKSVTSRVTVIVYPGTYTFGNTKFAVNTQYIDIVSLTGNADVILDGINVTANNVYLKGLNSGTNFFIISSSLNLLKCENCIGGAYSWGNENIIISGTFINCIGGDYSFGGNGGIASGTFTNCKGSDSSFGGNTGTASGVFTNCIGSGYSFGNGGIASGTFIDCIGGDGSFGGNGGTASGTFTNCKGSDYSFGNGGELSATARLYYCRLIEGEFPLVELGGRTYYCVDGNGNTNNQ